MAVFLVPRSGVSRALRCEGGVACGAVFNGGMLISPRGLRDHAAERQRRDPSPERVRAVGTVTGADGQAAVEIRRQADLNDARKRVPTAKRVGMSADRRRGWARGELPRSASPRAPSPEARRPHSLSGEQERGRGERVSQARDERVPPEPQQAARKAVPCQGRAPPRQSRRRGMAEAGEAEAVARGRSAGIAYSPSRASGEGSA